MMFGEWISPDRPMERPGHLRGAHAAAGNQPELGDVIADATPGPVDQRPAGANQPKRLAVELEHPGAALSNV